jgi:uncharacterized membrane protein
VYAAGAVPDSLDSLRQALAPAYGWLKALHVLAVMAWAWSTAVAYVYFVKPAYRRALRHPEDAAARAERDRFMELFDRGVVIEHVAFLVILLSGVLLLWIAGFTLLQWSWLLAKLLLVALVFVPMEIVDVYLAHGTGNKRRLRRAGDGERHARMMERHWRFFRVTEPIVMVLIPMAIVLAIAKPF